MIPQSCFEYLVLFIEAGLYDTSKAAYGCLVYLMIFLTLLISVELYNTIDVELSWVSDVVYRG